MPATGPTLMAEDKPTGPDRPEHVSDSTGYSMLSYMLGGMILYGAIGWLVGRWLHLPVLLPIGMIVGIGLGIALIIFRVTRS